MRTLNQREKRIVLIGGILVVLCGVSFLYRMVWPPLQAWRAQYVQLVKEAQALKVQTTLYADKAAAAKKLMESYHLDPAKLSRTTVLAEANAAIQRAALGERIAIGSVRESAARGSAKEVGSIEMELTGPVQGILSLLQRLDSLGYPVVIERIEVDPPGAGGAPGMPGGMPPGLAAGLPPGVRIGGAAGAAIMPGAGPIGMPGGRGGGAPGSLKVKLTFGILDYEQWKLEGKRNA